MTKIELCDTQRNNLIAAAIGLQQCTKTAANLVPLADGRVIAIGTPADVARLLEIPAAGSASPAAAGLTDELRSAVQQMARALADGEWADLLTTDRDAAALETEIGKLIERAHAGVGAEPTEISGRLRNRAAQPMSNQDDAKLMLTAADECDRFYGGMLAWKKTAEKKDRDWQAERMGRVDDRCATRLAAPSSDDVRNAAPWIRASGLLPEVPANDNQQFIVACRRGNNGKTYVFAADYLNARDLHNDDEGAVSLTGWYTESEHPEYNGWFEPVCQAGDEVTHWMPLPAAPAAAQSVGDAGGDHA